MLVDVNGDGLDDWLYSDGTSTYVLLNNGAGWDATPSAQWTIATSTLYKSPDAGTNVYYDRGIRFFDINGDGLPDFIHSYQMSYTTKNGGVASGENGTYNTVSINTGNGWATSTAYTLPSTIVTGHVTSGNWDGTFTYNEYGNWIGNGQFAQDVMTTVSNSKGGQTSVTYTPTHECQSKQRRASLLIARRHRHGYLRRPRECRHHDLLLFRRQAIHVAWRARPQIRGLCQHHHERPRLADEHLF